MADAPSTIAALPFAGARAVEAHGHRGPPARLVERGAVQIVDREHELELIADRERKRAARRGREPIARDEDAEYRRIPLIGDTQGAVLGDEVPKGLPTAGAAVRNYRRPPALMDESFQAQDAKFAMKRLEASVSEGGLDR